MKKQNKFFFIHRSPFPIFVPTTILSTPTMKRIYYTGPALLLAALTACDTPGGGNKANGVVVDATLNTVTLATAEGDTLAFGTPGAGRSQAGGLQVGDTVDVFYAGTYSAGMPADSLAVRGRQLPDEGRLGPVERRTYEGLLPAASCPGIRYTLTVSAPRHSGDGTFSLTLTYLEAENGEDRSYHYAGKRLTQRGMPGDNDATVWQLVADDGRERFNFLVESDSVLTLLNDNFERSDSELNYSLRRTE